jgi:hypothetical protein
MVRRSVLGWTLAALALTGGRAATADPISLTGFVANDFTPGEITQVPGAINLSTPFAGNTSGWSLQSVGTDYNAASDTLALGLHEFANAQGQLPVAGDAYGTGVQGDPASQAAAAGVNPPGFAGDKSITVLFAPVAGTNAAGQPIAGAPVIIAGIPSDKTHAGTGIDGFTVANYSPSNPTTPSQSVPQWSYGTPLAAGTGSLAFDPSAQHPEFEFTINNFSKISGIDTTKGLFVRVYEGSLQDGGVGETDTGFMFIPPPAGQGLNTPEPATVLAWSIVLAGGAAIRLRHRRRVAR